VQPFQRVIQSCIPNGTLRVENSSGNKLREEDFDPAPLLGATFVGRFRELNLNR
jgi:hypothetical protein